MPAAPPAPRAVVPYDYAASFRLSGKPGNLIQDVINIGPEGTFVAMAIGYGFEEERGRELLLKTTANPLPEPFQPNEITLKNVPVEGLLAGFRVNPSYEPLVFRTDIPGGSSTGGIKRLSDQALPGFHQNKIFQRFKPTGEISFFFSMVDTGTGRELQDEPTHNLASLGKSNGERPFRVLAHPLTFLPRSTLRLQITEGSEEAQGTLFIVLYGYKVLAGSSCPEPVMRSWRGSPDCPIESIGRPSDRVIPFDYVTTFALSGRPGNLLEDEITVNAEGGFVATSIGYGLALEAKEEQEVRAAPEVAKVAVGATAGTVDLGEVPLRLLPASALSDGVRIRPSFTRFAFQDNGALSNALPPGLLDKLFERLNRPEDVSFRYSIHDSGRGMDLQNQPIHNVAGLGIANGDRPFKRLVRPLLFLPRSTIQVRVQEHFGRGRLHLVFQGYKLLGRPAPGGRP
jgi:hypothetical protein